MLGVCIKGSFGCREGRLLMMKKDECSLSRDEAVSTRRHPGANVTDNDTQ